MKKCGILLGLSGFLFASVAAASGIFSIVPNTTSSTLRSDGYATIVYTVTNESSKTLSGLTVTAAGTAQAGSLTVQNNTCTALAPSGTCNFDLVVKAAVKNQPSSFVLSPYVCAYGGGMLCSQPSSANRTQVTVGAAPATYAYFSVVAVDGLAETNANTLVSVNTTNLHLGTPATGLTFANNGTSGWGQGVAVSPDGSRVYVTSGMNTVVVLSAGAAPAILGSVEIPGVSYLSQLIVSPDGKTIYATSASDGHIYVVNNNDGVYTQGDSIAASGQALAMNQDGSKLFATNYGWGGNNSTGHLYIIDAEDPSDITTLSGCNLSYSYSIAISPDGNTVYVGNWGNGVSVFKYNGSAYTCSTSSVARPAAVTNMAITPDGRYLYVTNAGQALYVVDASTDTVIDADTLQISGIYGVAVTPDGKQLFISADTSPNAQTSSPAYVYTINSDGSLTNPQSIDVGGDQDTQGHFAG